MGAEKVNFVRKRLVYSQEKLFPKFRVSFQTMADGKTSPREVPIILFAKFCEDNNINLEKDEVYGADR